MTVDLITLLKKEQDGSEEEVLPDIQREPNLICYDLRDTNISINYEVNIKAEDQKEGQFMFKNIYSENPSCWNQA